MVGDPGAWWNGDVILAFLSGGTLVAAFILVVDPSSGAKSTPGNIIVVILAAILSMVFRVYASAFYGCFFAVALINALTPFLCKLECHLLYSLSSSVYHISHENTVLEEDAIVEESAIVKESTVFKENAVVKDTTVFKENAVSKGSTIPTGNAISTGNVASRGGVR
jgi:hypothetical protein